jgi:hypothetical protein
VALEVPEDSTSCSSVRLLFLFPFSPWEWADGGEEAVRRESETSSSLPSYSVVASGLHSLMRDIQEDRPLQEVVEEMREYMVLQIANAQFE